VEAFPMGVYYFLCRIVIFYNDLGRSQQGRCSPSPGGVETSEDRHPTPAHISLRSM
jgi:hypothetical protein